MSTPRPLPEYHLSTLNSKRADLVIAVTNQAMMRAPGPFWQLLEIDHDASAPDFADLVPAEERPAASVSFSGFGVGERHRPRLVLSGRDFVNLTDDQATRAVRLGFGRMFTAIIAQSPNALPTLADAVREVVTTGAKRNQPRQELAAFVTNHLSVRAAQNGLQVDPISEAVLVEEAVARFLDADKGPYFLRQPVGQKISIMVPRAVGDLARRFAAHLRATEDLDDRRAYRSTLGFDPENSSEVDVSSAIHQGVTWSRSPEPGLTPPWGDLG